MSQHPAVARGDGGPLGVAGTVLTVLGIRQLGRERVEVNPSGPTNVAKWTPRVIPWAAPESNAHGGAAGLAVVF